MMELKVKMRQKLDMSFSQMLNRLRKGEHTADGIKALQGIWFQVNLLIYLSLHLT